MTINIFETFKKLTNMYIYLIPKSDKKEETEDTELTHWILK